MQKKKRKRQKFFLIKKWDDWFIFILGVVFIVLGILAIFNSLYHKNNMQIFWMCYISLLIIGFGLLRKNAWLIASQLSILAIPLIVWDIDFIHWIIFQSPLFGIADYFFISPGFSLGKFISLQHLVTVPLGLFSIYLIKLKKKDYWKFSMAQIVVVFLVVYFFTSPSDNINCVFDSCVNFVGNFYYQFTWFLSFFSLIIITSFIMNQFKWLFE